MTPTALLAYCMAATLYNVQQCFGFVVDSPAIGVALAGLAPDRREAT